MYKYRSKIFRSVGERGADHFFNEWMDKHQEEIYEIKDFIFKTDQKDESICIFYREKSKDPFKPNVQDKKGE